MLTDNQISLYKNCLFLKEQAIITYGKEVKANYDITKDKKILEKVEAVYRSSGYDDDTVKEVMKQITSYDDMNNFDGFGTSAHMSQTGEDGIDSIQGNNFKTLDNKKMEYLLESKNIVEDFKNFMSFEFDNIYNKYKSGKVDSFKISGFNATQGEIEAEYPKEIAQLTSNIVQSIDTLKQMGVDKNEIHNYLIRNLIIDSEDPDEIKKLIKLRVDYNKAMTTMFENMLRTNYKVLGVSTKEIEVLISDLNSGTQSKEEQAMSAIRKLVRENKDKFLFEKDGLIDFRPLGGGIILGPKNFKDEQATLPEAIETPERYLQSAFKWDVTIISHGGEMYEDEDEEDEDYTYWYIQPTFFKGKEYTRLNDLLKALIKAGYKKIKVNSCNPAHKDLDPEILNKSGIRIHFAKNSVIRESNDLNIDSVIENLEEAENSLINLAEDYDIDYWDNALLRESYLEIENNSFILNESKVWDFIKVLVKKFIKAIIFIWKKIIEFFKFIWQKIKEFITKKMNTHKNRKAKKKIKSSFIIVNNNSAGLNNIETDNIKDLSSVITNSCSVISNSIKRNNQVQNQMTKLYSDKLERIIREKEQQEIR